MAELTIDQLATDTEFQLRLTLPACTTEVHGNAARLRFRRPVKLDRQRVNWALCSDCFDHVTNAIGGRFEPGESVCYETLAISRSSSLHYPPTLIR